VSQVDHAAVTFPPPAQAFAAREPLKMFTLDPYEFDHHGHIWSVRAPGHRRRGSVLFREVRHISFIVR
jgi:hypothetical protein